MLVGGKKQQQAFNLTHTVADIFAHVKSLSTATGSFTLSSGYPPKRLTNLKLTIKDAKLEGMVASCVAVHAQAAVRAGASITQKAAD